MVPGVESPRHNETFNPRVIAKQEDAKLSRQTLKFSHTLFLLLLVRTFWLTGILCGSRVFGANMRCEFVVALVFVVRLHLVDGFTDERP
jgi:hypothetical protein